MSLLRSRHWHNPLLQRVQRHAAFATLFSQRPVETPAPGSHGQAVQRLLMGQIVTAPDEAATPAPLMPTSEEVVTLPLLQANIGAPLSRGLQVAPSAPAIAPLPVQRQPVTAKSASVPPMAASMSDQPGQATTPIARPPAAIEDATTVSADTPVDLSPDSDDDQSWTRLQTIRRLHEAARNTSAPAAMAHSTMPRPAPSGATAMVNEQADNQPLAPLIAQRSPIVTATPGAPTALVQPTQSAWPSDAASTVEASAGLSLPAGVVDPVTEPTTVAEEFTLSEPSATSTPMATPASAPSRIADAAIIQLPVVQKPEQRSAARLAQPEAPMTQRRVATAAPTTASASLPAVSQPAPAPTVEPKRAEPALLSAALPEEVGAMEVSAEEQPLPLQAVWPVTQMEGRNLSLGEARLPDVPSATLAATDPALHADIRQKLVSIPSQQATDAAVDVIPPRRARPAPRARERTENSLSAAAATPDKAPVQQAAADQSGAPVQRSPVIEPRLVETPVGPLPADLWQLIGQTPPLSATPEPTPKSAIANVHGHGPTVARLAPADRAPVEQEQLPVVQPALTGANPDVSAPPPSLQLSAIAAPALAVAATTAIGGAPETATDVAMIPIQPVSAPATIASSQAANAVVQRRFANLAAEAESTVSLPPPVVLPLDNDRVGTAKAVVEEPMLLSSPVSASGRHVAVKATSHPPRPPESSAASATIQRQVDSTVASEPATVSPALTELSTVEKKTPPIDTDELARQVYARLRRKLVIERERLR